MRLVCLLLIGLMVSQSAFASVGQESAIKAIIGEARGCSDYEQQAIASAIVNRGSVVGVYGYTAHIANLDHKTYQKALNAYKRAIVEDITSGATHWLSNWDLKHCRPSLIKWKDSMRVTLKTEHFTFYKERA